MINLNEKMMRFISLCILILFVSLGCKKRYVLKGRLMSTCDVTASNEELTLRVGGKMYGEHFHGVTDENGNFEIPYESSKFKTLVLRNKMSAIPVGNVDVGKVYNAIKYSVIISLSVDSSYTSLDTLVIRGNKYAGPFQSGIIDTLDNFYIEQNDEEVIKYGQLEYSQKVNYLLMSNGVNEWSKSESFNIQVCDGIYHEVTIKL